MLPLSKLLEQSLSMKRPRSRRAVLLQDIITKLKAERGDQTHYIKNGKRIKLTPITDELIAIRTSHYTEEQLEDLFSACKHSKSGFSRTFWAITRTING